MADRTRDVNQKTLEMNSDGLWYGSLAEIGGGQETARWLFRVGRASGTVAKSMSAYDMAFSDAIYGHSARYVSRQRLIQMLEHEYGLLLSRLGDRGETKRFFAFANTVATRSHKHREPGRGWLGIRFQSKPGAEYSQIIIHTQLHDWENLHQQEALGLLGINLIYGAFALADRPDALVDSLMDNLRRERVEVDMIHFEGPMATGVDNRRLSLRLVSEGMTEATMFTAEGRTVQPAEQLWGQPVLVQRGTFHPITWPIVHMLDRAQERVRVEAEEPCEPVVVSEMNLPEVRQDEALNEQELLGRMEVLQRLGRDVLISNFREHFRLTQLICRYTSRRVGLVMGAATIPVIFDSQYYRELDGGLLEALGRLCKWNVRLYVYPYKDRSGNRVTAESLKLPASAQVLYRYLQEAGTIHALEPDPASRLDVFPEDVRQMVQRGESGWEELVPEPVAEAIRAGRFRWGEG